MSINQLKKCFLLTAIALLCAFGSNAQEAFEKGKLYHIYGAGEKENLVAEKMGETAGFLDYDKEDPSIYWKLSELSGSWRIINPVTNNALRINGNTVEVGENNGSDEAQLWKFEDGMIIPANNPTLAIAKGKGGTLVVIKKERAANMRAAKFKIQASEVAGFDDDLTYHICPVTMPGKVLGNGDSSENNARIVSEDTVSGNRGQYWSIKTIDLFTFAVENTFYGTNFDDGGSNPAIDYLLQWPATAGVWNNAKFHFEPVAKQQGVYLITSAGKEGTMYALKEGQMMLVEKNPADSAAWFTFAQVEKPKINAPHWEDETMFAENKERGVATYMPYDNVKKMLADKEYYADRKSTRLNSSHQV